MKDFNLEAALNGSPLVTREGKPAMNFRVDDPPVSPNQWAIYRAEVNGETLCFKPSGNFAIGNHRHDLFLADRPHPAPESEAENLARLFHETYERLAPSFGYETRKDSAVPWVDVPEKNKRLMIAVAGEVWQAALQSRGGADAFIAELYEQEPNLKEEGLERFDGYFVHWDKIIKQCATAGVDGYSQSPAELITRLIDQRDEALTALRGADEALACTYWTSDDGENIRDSEPEESGANNYVIERWKKICRILASLSEKTRQSDWTAKDAVGRPDGGPV